MVKEMKKRNGNAPVISVYLGANPGRNPLYAEKVRELGRWIGESGYDLVYGGSKIGLMGMLAEAALEAGAYVIGVEPQFFIDSVLQLETLDELIVTQTMSERKAKIIELADVFIAFPGGTGTLEEISEIMSAVSLNLIRGVCIIYNLNGYYDHLEALLDHMVEEGLVHPENRKKIHFCKNLAEIGKMISHGIS